MITHRHGEAVADLGEQEIDSVRFHPVTNWE